MTRIPMRFRGLTGGLTALALLGACSGPLNGVGGKSDSATGLADRAASAGDYETAAMLYQQVFDANPKSTEALVGLGRSYSGLGQHSRAQQALLEAQRREPRNAEVLLELGRAQLTAGNAEGALESLEAARKLQPRDIQIITAQGIALDRLSRHQQAQAVYREGLARKPTDFALLSNLGLSLGLSGQSEEGIRILRELARDNKASIRTRGNLALVYGLAGREKDARITLATDLSHNEINSNIAYYRELRTMLAQGRPIGGSVGGPQGQVNTKKPATVPAQPQAVAKANTDKPTTAVASKPPAASEKPATRTAAKPAGTQPAPAAGTATATAEAEKPIVSSDGKPAADSKLLVEGAPEAAPAPKVAEEQTPKPAENDWQPASGQAR